MYSAALLLDVGEVDTGVRVLCFSCGLGLLGGAPWLACCLIGFTEALGTVLLPAAKGVVLWCAGALLAGGVWSLVPSFLQ